MHNRSAVQVQLADFEAAFVRPSDRRRRARSCRNWPPIVSWPSPSGPNPMMAGHTYNDFSTADLIDKKGYEVRVKIEQGYDRIPSDRRQSEGWAWTHGAQHAGDFQVRPGEHAVERAGGRSQGPRAWACDSAAWRCSTANRPTWAACSRGKR